MSAADVRNALRAGAEVDRALASPPPPTIGPVTRPAAPPADLATHDVAGKVVVLAGEAAEQITDEQARRLLDGGALLVLANPDRADVFTSLDEEEMRAAGWVRAPVVETPGGSG